MENSNKQTITAAINLPSLQTESNSIENVLQISSMSIHNGDGEL